MSLRINKDVVVTTHIDFLRSLRPVGQGAFFTEVFKKDDGTLFTVVYDCGTETDSSILDAQIDEFKKGLLRLTSCSYHIFIRTILVDLINC